MHVLLSSDVWTPNENLSQRQIYAGGPHVRSFTGKGDMV
jgi:hypothetical protein